MTRLFLDVDGTLVGKDDEPRPNLEDILKRLSKCFDAIYVWSAGGGNDYAKPKIERLRLTKYVTAYFWKAGFEEHHIGKNDVCIDDERSVVESFFRRGGVGFWVPYYEPHVKDEKNHNALEEVCRKIEKKLHEKETVRR